jgi:signal transduction histidine kinase
MKDAFKEDLRAIAEIDAVPLILEVACRTTGLRFAAVARVTAERWLACAVRDEIAFGLQPGGELRVETTLCDEVRIGDQPVVIDHATEDELFCGHPTPKMYGFQSYISVPIYRPDGRFFGTLCALDPKPAVLRTPQTIGMFKLFAALIGFHLDAQERVTTGEAALRNERQNTDLREQFIAVLGHDLRNPLNSIDLGAKLLLKKSLNEETTKVAQLIGNSAARMSGLIDNVLDFARSRLGGGFSLTLTADSGLGQTLEQVLAEVRMAWPGRIIQSELQLRQPVVCDPARLAQLFSNLLINALTHGDSTWPVTVYAHSSKGVFELSITNRGAPIPLDKVERLFQPFTRDSVQPGQQGLGLGLYIASEIAQAHAGSLKVTSTPDETRFTFRMPTDSE